MAKHSKYKLSFTGASLRLNEMVKVARAANEMGITDLRMVKVSGVVFGSVKSRTSTREFQEIQKRLESLTLDQLDVLIHGDLISQKQIGFLAVCKSYDFIRDFTIEVLRDKTLVYDYTINESDFNSFIDRRLNVHPELESFSESTLRKAKQVMFRILEQAGIINNAVDRIIQPQIVQPDVIRSVVKEDPSWLKVFLMSDMDIKQVKY
ncbi:MAG TPA: DUF1819 family protein [Bacteroidales bacterium]|nr:DUF1819 family protein [Bacteroidales bacterium]